MVACFQTPEKLHGQIYTGIRDVAFAWSKNETRLAYVAEKQVAEGEALWKNVNDKKKDTEEDQRDTTANDGKYAFEEDWGEAYVGQKTGDLFIAEIATGKCIRVANIPETLSCAEPCWTPDDSGLVFTGCLFF